ncbi:hypothetical protein [Afifella sp. IM 167]|uniref:hypothetical protein n=1 Tax=Afifella sp. IM 167 TaxID=2033586 RepID=UPI001CC98440|nr:hypothetical protein [Afifella sp. IM 167]MBZ8134627.1 hypothetical protein [Afifella sp. IM 167]
MARRAALSVVLSFAFAASSFPAFAEMPRLPGNTEAMSTAPIIEVGEYLPGSSGAVPYPPPGARTYGPGTRFDGSGPRYRSYNYRDRRYYRSPRYYRSDRYDRRRYYRQHRYDGGFTAGALGLGLGFALGNTFAQPRYYRSAPVYAGVCRPWTQAWYQRCSRFKTFNPRTGYYFYKPGRKRFCSC